MLIHIGKRPGVIRRAPRLLSAVWGSALVGMLLPILGHTELNFTGEPDPVKRIDSGEEAFVMCNMSGQTDVGCGDSWLFNRFDPTPFLQEIVKDTDGKVYYHMVIDDPLNGFSQEMYMGRGVDTIQGNRVSASLGGRVEDACFGGITVEERLHGCGNGALPLEGDKVYTGNGSGNPNRIIMRQVLDDAQMSQEFTKAAFDKKPKITQSTTDITQGVTGNFVIDMSNSTYLDDTTPGSMVNTLTFDALPGENRPFAPKNFDMSVDGQNVKVTGGRYTYTDGTTWGVSGAGGTYNYVEDGGFNLDIDWSIFKDPAQNP